MTDSLDRIFQLQKELDHRIERENVTKVIDWLGSMDIEKRLNAKMQAVIHEAVEVQRLTGWKWWKKQHTPLNKDEALKELVDIEHFLISAVLDLGFTPEEFYEAYVGKNKENQDRQDRKY